MKQSRRGASRWFWAGWLLALASVVSAAYAAPAVAELDLQRWRGKVVLVDFWASWCAPCRHSFPWLNQMHAKYAARGLVVIGVNVDRTRAAAERFLSEVPARFEILYDPAGTLAARYEVPGMPSSYLFGPGGELIARHIGFRNALREEREAEIERLLSRPDVRAATQ